ncbi:MAG: 3-methyl-2-oxobutanoate hydroxymethyltransferase, partial [Solirubrobacterales bacterium]
TALGGLKAQGRTAEAAAKLTEEALALQAVGCFAIVFEAIPSAVTEALMPKLEVPVIGIGAGPATDGQVLVLHDLLGVYAGHKPKFVKRFANVREESLKGVRTYTEEVRARTFPREDEHTYSIPQEELEEFARYLEEEALVGTDTPWDW